MRQVQTVLYFVFLRTGRIFEKFAVLSGGGKNHRFGLFDGILIKDNHIALSGSIKEAIKKAKNSSDKSIKVEVEVDNIDQFQEALENNPDIILLDNFSTSELNKSSTTKLRPSINFSILLLIS